MTRNASILEVPQIKVVIPQPRQAVRRSAMRPLLGQPQSTAHLLAGDPALGLLP